VNLSEDTWLVSTDQQRGTSTISVWLSRARAGLGRVVAYLAAHRRRLQDAEVLNTFSDRDLWDLGLSRSDIPGIISGRYRRD
jgi:uncharacterized protein YjiS (DUF1127 family)